MFVGIGVGIGRQRFAGGFADSYSARVLADGGTIESLSCVASASALLQTASLLLIPSGYKAGVAYSALPNNGNGDLTWSRGSDAFRTNASGLIQRVPWNLFSWSEAFTNSAWSKSKATITADTITAPNGTLTADTIAFTTAGFVVQSFTHNGLMTFSLYAKYIATRWLCVENFNSVDKAAWFDLQNGVVGSTINGATSTITNVGDGWYRCAVTMTAVSSSASQYAFFTVSADSSFTRSGSAYFWGAQLVEGTTAQTYLPTTDRLNFPRLDYTYGSCPSALLEPQRTNLVFPSATATTQSRTVTAVAHTFSFWGTGSVVLSGAFSGTLNGTGASNRVNLTFTPTAGSLTLTVSGSVTNWQLEAGSYATTLIDTTTASATRLADTFTRNNIYTNGLISVNGGTWYVELKNNVSYTRDAGSEGLFIGDTSIGTTNSLQIICPLGGGRLRINKRIATIGTSLYNTLTDNVKIAIKWNGTTADVFVNGVKVVSATAFTTTNMEFLNGLSADVPKFIQAMALYNEPKSDQFCIDLTT